MADAQLDIVIRAQNEAQAALNELNGQITQLNGNMEGAAPKAQSMFGAFVVGQLAVNAAYAAFNSLKGVITSSMQAASDAERSQAQLGAVIRSTGGAAGVTATSAIQLAESMQKMQAVSKDAILAGESMLLTFTNIHAETFPRATQAVLDMTTAMNGGMTPSAEQMKDASIQLGKALNDPTVGLTALQRVGVTFSEDQKKVITTLAETGKVAEAQKLILDELSKEFGGSASAAAQTYEGRMRTLKNTIGEVQEGIGKSLMPTLNLLVGQAQEAANGAENMANANDNLAIKIYQATNYVQALGLELVAVWKALNLAVDGFLDLAGVVGGVFSDAASNLMGMFDAILSGLTGVWKAVTGDISGAISSFEKAGKQFSNSFKFEETKRAAKVLAVDMTADAKSVYDSFISGGMAMSRAYDTKAITQQISNQRDASKAAQEHLDKIAKASTGAYTQVGKDAKEAAEKQAKAAEKAATEYKRTIKDAEESIAEIRRDFSKQAQDDLNSYYSKVKKLSDDQVKLAEDTAKKVKDAQAKGTETAVTAYEEAQAKLDDLREKQRNFWGGKESTQANLAEFNKIGLEMSQIQDALNKNKDLAELAAKDAGIYGAKGGTGVDAITAARNKAAEEVNQIKSDAAEKAKAIQASLDEETMRYAKQKQDLIDSTVDKYERVKKAASDGIQKVIDATKAKSAELRAAESELNGLLKTVGSAESGAKSASPYETKGTGAQQVTVNILSNATVHAASETDVKTLAKTVADAVAKTMQAGRSGLSTAY